MAVQGAELARPGAEVDLPDAAGRVDGDRPGGHGCGRAARSTPPTAAAAAEPGMRQGLPLPRPGSARRVGPRHSLALSGPTDRRLVRWTRARLVHGAGGRVEAPWATSLGGLGCREVVRRAWFGTISGRCLPNRCVRRRVTRRPWARPGPGGAAAPGAPPAGWGRVPGWWRGGTGWSRCSAGARWAPCGPRPMRCCSAGWRSNGCRRISGGPADPAGEGPCRLVGRSVRPPGPRGGSPVACRVLG